MEILPNEEVYVVKNTSTKNSTEIHATSMSDLVIAGINNHVIKTEKERIEFCAKDTNHI